MTVTDADRQAAADAVKAYRDQRNNNWQQRIRDGLCDDGEMVQAFARHREAAEAPLRAEVERLKAQCDVFSAFVMEAVERIEKGDLDERMCCDGHMCGCQGSTNADQFLHFARAALEPKP